MIVIIRKTVEQIFNHTHIFRKLYMYSASPARYYMRKEAHIRIFRLPAVHLI